MDRCIFCESHVEMPTLKRSFDIVISTFLLLGLSPLFLIVAFLILIDSEGTLFFSQTRIGKQVKHLEMCKFFL